MSKLLIDTELLEQGLVVGTREEAMQYHQAYKRYGTSQTHPVNAIFDLFEEKIYKEKFISYMMGKNNYDRDMALAEVEAHIESMGDDIDYSDAHIDADECMSNWTV